MMSAARKYLVLIYVLFCLLQVAVSFERGYSFVKFEWASDAAEESLLEFPFTDFQLNQAERSIELAEASLFDAGPGDSRPARLVLDRAILYWARGQLDAAVESFEKAIREFDRLHGPDSFHSNAVRLRYAELLIWQRKYEAAAAEMSRALPRVTDYLGSRDLFVVRMGLQQARITVYMGDKPRGAAQFKRLLPLFLREIEKFDAGVLASVGQSLDFLVYDGLFHPPASGGTWAEILRQKKSSENP